MSASSKKKLRKAENEAKLTERQRKEQADAKKLKIYSIAFTILIIAIILVTVTVLVWQWIVNDGIIQKWTTALKIGDHKINCVEMNYYYRYAISAFLQNSGNSIETAKALYGVDLTLPLNTQQYYSENRMWSDFFMEQAVELAVSDYTMADAAAAAGYTMTADDLSYYDDQLKMIESQAASSGYTDLDTYVRANYGNGSDYESFKVFLRRNILAESYRAYYAETIAVPEDKITSYNTEHFNDYSSFTYNTYNVMFSSYLTGGTEDTESGEITYSEEEHKASQEAAKAVADKLAAVTSVEELDAAIAKMYEEQVAASKEDAATEETGEKEETAEETTAENTENTVAENTEETTTENTENQETATDTNATTEETTEETAQESEVEQPTSTVPTSTENANILYASVPEEYQEWISDSARKTGDIKVFEKVTTSYVDDVETKTTSGYTVVIFVSRDDNTAKLDTVRQIFVPVQEDEVSGETTVDSDYFEFAFDEAKAIEEELTTMGVTEANFISLVQKYSQDAESVDGLYEYISTHDNYYGTSFSNTAKAWAVDPARQAGDVEIVEGDSGYHILYYVGESDDSYRHHSIKLELQSRLAEEWYNNVIAAAKTNVKRRNFKPIDVSQALYMTTSAVEE